MLLAVHAGLRRCHRLWTRCDPTIFEYPNVNEQHWVDLPTTVARLDRNLARSRDECSQCNKVYETHLARMQEACKRPDSDACCTDDKDENRSNQSSEGEEKDNSDDEELQVAEQTQCMPTHLRNHKEMKRARRRVDWKPRAPPRPHAPMMPLPAQRFQMLPGSRFQDFDRYDDGPPLEDLKLFQRQGGLEGYPLDWDAQPTIRSDWELFRDHGYRLEREFALMFNQQEPLFVKEHLLPPIPTHETPIPSDDEELPPNLVTMGMGEMLEAAGLEGSEASMNMFVKGITEEGDWIRMDPARDEYQLTAREYMLSMDIDSIIWITYALRVLTDLAVHVLPYQGKKPPIPKSNHAYVEILMPQSEADKESLGPRTEWYTVKRSLSVIPHTHFAKFSHGTTTFNVYVMFPRMMHKNPLTGWTATIIPFEVQSRWLVEVVYPAIVAGENPSTMAYKGHTMDEWRWKASNNKRFGDFVKTVPVKGTHLPDLMVALRDICDSSDELDMFRSFFFVMDARGMKEATSIVVREPVKVDPDVFTNFKVQEGESLWDELCSKFTCLDWDYMMDRANGGQLLMDLGMAFHPCAKDKTPLVCMWKLDSVLHSYQAAGMTAGTTHYANTFIDYGGKQAEMGSVRQRTVQVAYRLTYGLHYQPVRRGKGGDISFCGDVDAYDANASFRKCGDDFIQMLLGGRNKNLGARDEIRASGVAIKRVLEAAPDLVGFNFTLGTKMTVP